MWFLEFYGVSVSVYGVAWFADLVVVRLIRRLSARVIMTVGTKGMIRGRIKMSARRRRRKRKRIRRRKGRGMRMRKRKRRRRRKGRGMGMRMRMRMRTRRMRMRTRRMGIMKGTAREITEDMTKRALTEDVAGLVTEIMARARARATRVMTGARGSRHPVPTAAPALTPSTSGGHTGSKG